MSRRAAILLIVVLVLGAYWLWLLPGVLTYGDWGFLSKARMLDYYPFPEIWSSANGLGNFQNVALLSFPVHGLMGLLAHLGVGYAWAERLIWYLPFVVLAPVGMYVLLTALFKKRVVATVGALFYSLNTYTLGTVSGGLLTIGMGMALAPLVIWLFIRAFERSRWSDRILAGLLLALQMQYDSRVSYLTLLVFLSYVLFHMLYVRQPSVSTRLRSLGWLAAGAGGVVAGLNLYWIVPALFAGNVTPELPITHLDANWIRVLSYMTPSHAWALLHPFWVGGEFPNKVQPVVWYFYFWPLLAFSAILLARRDWRIVWLLGVALAGVFLVKGAYGPVPGGYIWLFSHVPGFNAFRDPSKHFIIVALAYSGLIGLTVEAAGRYLAAVVSRRWLKRILAVLPLTLFCVLLVVCVRQAYFGSVGRSFTVRHVPASYQHLADFIGQDQEFYRTLWVPIQQRFAPADHTHPAVGAAFLAQNEFKSLETNPKQVESWLYNSNAEYLLSAMAVKYVVVPEDTEGDIFRNYEDRQAYIARLDNLPFLTPVSGFEPLKVYRNKYFSRHIYPATEIDSLSLAAARDVGIPEFDRLLDTGPTPARNPGLLITNSNAVTSQDRFGGGQVLDIAAASQQPNKLSVPFSVVTAGPYQLWAHRVGDQSDIRSAQVVTANGTVVYRNDNVEPAATVRQFNNLFGFKNQSLTTTANQLSPLTDEARQAGYVWLGTADVSPGSYRLVIEDQGIYGRTSVRNASFEDSLPPGVPASSDSTDQARSVQVSGGSALSDVPLEVDGFDPETTYRVTFDYKSVSGSGSYYGLEWIGVPATLPPQSLPVSTDWQRFTTVAKPPPGATGLRLHFYARGKDASPSVNRYDNVHVVPTDPIDNLFMRSDTTSQPNVSFDRLSDTRYAVHVSNARQPFYLTFAETYHPGWVLQRRDGERLTSIDAPHVVMNSYANAWYINQRGDYRLEIDFKPQQLLVVGGYLSLAALAVIGLLLMLTLWRKW